MQIIFNLSGVFTADSNRLENAITLRALLDALIATDLAYLRFHKAPKLYNSGVRYGRTDEWLRIPNVMRNGFADCKSLSAWKCAELTLQGYQARPVFRFQPRARSGIPDFHILIQTDSPEAKTDKGWMCPSRRLGMSNPEASYFNIR